MGDAVSTTSLSWKIDIDEKNEWVKKHKKDTRLVTEFENFEESVTQDPYLTNPKVKPLKGRMKDYFEYKKKPVRGVYLLEKPSFTIHLHSFEYKGNTDYR